MSRRSRKLLKSIVIGFLLRPGVDPGCISGGDGTGRGPATRPSLEDAIELALGQPSAYRQAQEGPGHSTVLLTLDTYSHVLPSMQKAATDKLDKMLYGT